ncbi:hypothetical protein WG66_011002 [Moniliophthora roreri]|nr:hypothetical protein WG66_011002 [Moniliophthora roreri]
MIFVPLGQSVRFQQGTSLPYFLGRREFLPAFDLLNAAHERDVYHRTIADSSMRVFRDRIALVDWTNDRASSLGPSLLSSPK